MSDILFSLFGLLVFSFHIRFEPSVLLYGFSYLLQPVLARIAEQTAYTPTDHSTSDQTVILHQQLFLFLINLMQILYHTLFSFLKFFLLILELFLRSGWWILPQFELLFLERYFDVSFDYVMLQFVLKLAIVLVSELIEFGVCFEAMSEVLWKRTADERVLFLERLVWDMLGRGFLGKSFLWSGWVRLGDKVYRFLHINYIATDTNSNSTSK